MSSVDIITSSGQQIGGTETHAASEKKKPAPVRIADTPAPARKADTPAPVVQESYTPSREVGSSIRRPDSKKKASLFEDMKRLWGTDGEDTTQERAESGDRKQDLNSGESGSLQTRGPKEGAGDTRRLPESLFKSGAVAQAASQHIRKEKGSSPKPEAGTECSLPKLDEESDASASESRGEKAPPTDEERVMAATRPDPKKDSPEASELKKKYRDAYRNAGEELRSARDAAAQGMGTHTLADGAKQEVRLAENGNTLVRTTNSDGSVKSVQFNPAYPGRVLIEKSAPPKPDGNGNMVAEKEPAILRSGTSLTIGPGEAETVSSRGSAGSSLTYKLDYLGRIDALEVSGSTDRYGPYSYRHSRIVDEGKVRTVADTMKNTEEQLDAAHKSNEIPWLRDRIQNNNEYRDNLGRPINGAGQTVAILEHDLNRFAGRLTMHGKIVQDIVNSQELGVAPGAGTRLFEKRPDDLSGMLPGFVSSHFPPKENIIPDNKEALIKELDKVMRFDGRINPELDKILEAQRNGAGMNVLNMSFGETPDVYMDQVLSLLTVKEQGGSYAYPGLRKSILGENADNVSTKETMKKVADFIKERMNDPNSGFQKGLGEYRKKLHELTESGITVVVAANNGHQAAPNTEEKLPPWDDVSPGSTLNYFGRSDDAITVAASDSRGTPGIYSDDAIGRLSSRGEGEGGWNPTVAAPGVNMNTASGWIADGTSAATPYVAGVIALMKQANPGLTTARIKQILIDTATNIEQGLSADGAGIVDPEKALRMALKMAG